VIIFVDINKQRPWGYFDGACQGPNGICGIGFILYFSYSHYLFGKSNLGSGTNNVA